MHFWLTFFLGLSSVECHWFFIFFFSPLLSFEYLCVISCVSTVFSFTVSPAYTDQLKLLGGAVHSSLDTCRRKEAALARRVLLAGNQRWRRAAKISHLRMLWSAATESRFSEKKPACFVPVPSLILLGSAVCAACLWKQSPAAATNTGLLKINMFCHAWTFKRLSSPSRSLKTSPASKEQSCFFDKAEKVI